MKLEKFLSCVVVILTVGVMVNMAADNFVRGYGFYGSRGLKTGANLEDLVTQSQLTTNSVSSANTSRIFSPDFFEVGAESGCTSYVLKVKSGGITTTEILDSTITSNDIAVGGIDEINIVDGAITQDKLAVGAGVPVGSILTWPTDTAPSGWLLCTGGTYAASGTYTNLYDVLGYVYGGSGANFQVPDYRGYFHRMRDWSEGNDPDAAGRTDRGDGTGGDNVGSVQTNSIQSHAHNVQLRDDDGSVGAWALGEGETDGANKGLQATSSTGGNETRPINIYVNYIIKY
jgi:microcystin-dependent protein